MIILWKGLHEKQTFFSFNTLTTYILSIFIPFMIIYNAKLHFSLVLLQYVRNIM